MKVLAQLLLVSSLFLTISSSVFAGEGIKDIAAAKQQKDALVKALQQRIALHQTMSQDQIIADIQSLTTQARANLSAANNNRAVEAYDKSMSALKTELAAAPDRDAILALEQAQLQQVMSSENIMFMVSRAYIRAVDGPPANDFVEFIGNMGLIVTISIDLAIIPIEIAVTLITGE